jgi:hypothetical protein
VGVSGRRWVGGRRGRHPGTAAAATTRSITPPPPSSGPAGFPAGLCDRDPGVRVPALHPHRHDLLPRRRRLGRRHHPPPSPAPHRAVGGGGGDFGWAALGCAGLRVGAALGMWRWGGSRGNGDQMCRCRQAEGWARWLCAGRRTKQTAGGGGSRAAGGGSARLHVCVEVAGGAEGGGCRTRGCWTMHVPPAPSPPPLLLPSAAQERRRDARPSAQRLGLTRAQAHPWHSQHVRVEGVGRACSVVDACAGGETPPPAAGSLQPVASHASAFASRAPRHMVMRNLSMRFRLRASLWATESYGDEEPVDALQVARQLVGHRVRW